jgi:hypothetical protein
MCFSYNIVDDFEGINVEVMVFGEHERIGI